MFKLKRHVAFVGVVALVACLMGHWSVSFAQNVAPEQQAPKTTIDVGMDTTAEDTTIQRRILDIFSVLDGLETIDVNVSAGVVTLNGTLVDASDIDRAAAIASRVEGVVTVQNGIERDLSVEENIEPVLDKVAADVSSLTSAIPLFGIAVVVAIAIALFGQLIASLRPIWLWIAPNAFLAELIATSIRVIFIALGIFTALDIINATALLGAILGGAGVIGLAVGFAVRDTVDNYISSIMLSIRQPFRGNDFVSIGDRQGRVVRLTSRATILMTLDGNHLRIPNSTVFKAEILNFSRNPERRFTFELGVDADDDPAAAVETGLAAINALSFILRKPEATGSIKEVGDSNILLSFNGWINQRDTDFLKARGAAIRNTKIALEDAGFALPEPIYRLRFDGAPFPNTRDIDLQKAASNEAPPDPDSGLKKPHNRLPEDLDVAPDTHIEDLVNEERAETSEDDLLNDKQQQE